MIHANPKSEHLPKIVFDHVFKRGSAPFKKELKQFIAFQELERRRRRDAQNQGFKSWDELQDAREEEFQALMKGEINVR